MTEVDEDQLVAVDFDGVLTEGESLQWDDEPETPRDDVREWVQRQYDRGAHIVVWTARPWTQANEVAGRLNAWGVPFHGLRCDKGAADVYVDDKAVHPDDILGGGD